MEEIERAGQKDTQLTTALGEGSEEVKRLIDDLPNVSEADMAGFTQQMKAWIEGVEAKLKSGGFFGEFHRTLRGVKLGEKTPWNNEKDKKPEVLNKATDSLYEDAKRYGTEAIRTLALLKQESDKKLRALIDKSSPSKNNLFGKKGKAKNQ